MSTTLDCYGVPITGVGKADFQATSCGQCGRKFEHGKTETLGCSIKPCAMMPSHWPENRPDDGGGHA